jgi:hypothetical protein
MWAILTLETSGSEEEVMSMLALITAVVALVVAVAAYKRTGGRLQDLSPTADSVRDRTADALNHIEGLLRGKERSRPGERAESSTRGDRR